MSNTILVSAYFGGDRNDSKIGYFERLDDALKKHGFRIHLLSLNSQRIQSTCANESLFKLIDKAHWLHADRLFGALDVDPLIVHAASIDALCWNRRLRSETLRVLLFREHLRRALRRVQPRLYVAWHEFFSFHYTVPRMIRDEFPESSFLFAEFGPIPGTITFDREGQMGESEVATRAEKYRAQPVTDDDTRNAAALIECVRAEKRTRKPQARAGDPLRAHEATLARAKAVVFYAGQYDCRTGFVPATLPNAKLHSALFPDTLSALAHLGDLAAQDGWVIVFKPHPLVRISQRDLHAATSGRPIIVLRDANIFDCIERSNAVVTIVSQVSYMALIHDRPCVMLGSTYLRGKGCTYEPKSREEVVASIRAAIAEGFTIEQRSHWNRHAAQLLKYTLFGFDPDLHADGLRGTDDAAQFLLRASGTGKAPDEPRAAADDLSCDPAKSARFRKLYEVLSRF